MNDPGTIPLILLASVAVIAAIGTGVLVLATWFLNKRERRIWKRWHQ